MTRYCPVKNLQPDMVLAEDIYDNERILLLARGTVLTPSGINTIKKLGLEKVGIARHNQVPEPDHQRSGHIAARLKTFQRNYARSRDNFSGLLKHISAGHSVDLEKAYEIPGSILAGLDTLDHLFTYLHNVSGLDDETAGHSVNVALICAVAARWLNLDRHTAKELVVAGLLHDVGKSMVPAGILNKPGALSPDEWAEIKKHPLYGYRMLKQARLPEKLLVGALLHHEREDGSGYPLRLSGVKIPLVAKCVAIADIYDAMTSNRSYRAKLCPFEVIKQFRGHYFGVLDTGVLMTFLNRIADCYVGERVRLNDGREGEVVFINPRQPDLPIVKVAQDYLNLEKEPGLAIAGIVPAGN